MEVGAETEVAVTQRQAADIALRAYRDFGRGSGHAAGLNLGDCSAYALARDSREPLIFEGDDFTETDVLSALDHNPQSG